MGRATIQSGGPDGRYQIEIDVGTPQRAARLAALDRRIAELNQEIADRAPRLSLALDREAETAEAVDLQAQAYKAIWVAPSSTDGERTLAEAALGAASRDYRSALAEARAIEKAQAAARIELAATTRERLRVGALQLTRTMQAWCADLTEDAAGSVATIEVPGEPAEVLVAPSGRAPTANDGKLLARAMMSPEQVYWNAAVLPGWQRWRPTYRFGTIVTINAESETADVELQAAVSSAQGLYVDPIGQTMTAVPIQYMTCNAGAFLEGDEVVIQFDGQDRAHPRIIGFRSNPRACSWVCFGADTSAYVLSPPGSLEQRPARWSSVVTAALNNRVRVFWRHDYGAWRELQRWAGDPVRQLQYDDKREGQLISWPYVIFREYDRIYPDYPAPGYSEVPWVIEFGPFCDEAVAGAGLNQLRIYLDETVIVDFAVEVRGEKPPSYSNEQILPTYWAATGRIEPVEFSRPIAALDYNLRAKPDPTL